MLHKRLMEILAFLFLPVQLLGWLAYMVFAALRNGWWLAEIYFTRRTPK